MDAILLLKEVASLFRADVNPELGEDDLNELLDDVTSEEQVVSSLLSKSKSAYSEEFCFLNSSSIGSHISAKILSLLVGVGVFYSKFRFES
jgi:hypothetical protein